MTVRFVRVVAVVVVAVCCLIACGGGGPRVAPRPGPVVVPAPAGLVRPGVLTVAADFQGPPFDYLDGNEHAGFDVEFDRSVAGLMGLELESVDTRFASLVTGLEAGRFDAVVSVLYITADRARAIDLVPYAQTGSGFLVRRGGPFQPTAPEDLCGHSVAVLAAGFEEQLVTSGSVAAACARAGRPLTVKSFPTDAEATREVAAGRSDVFFSNQSNLLYRAKQVPELNLAVSTTRPLFPIPAGIGVRKDRPQVRAAFERAVAELTATGELPALLAKYGLEPPDPALVQRALAGNVY